MRILQRIAPDSLIILVLFLLPLAFFWQQTMGGKTLIPTENLFQDEPFATYREVVNAPEVPHNHLLSDLILQNYQWKSFIREQLAQGEIPLWNPHQFGGIPFLAAGQHSALYPLSIIYYLVDLPVAYGWFTVVNLWLAGAFMYALMRGFAVNRFSALLSSVIYQFAGFVIASVLFQMMIGAIVWLPLILLMSEYIVRGKPFWGFHEDTWGGKSIPWIAIGAAALGCNILAGHVEITLYTLLIVGWYAGLRLIFQLWGQRHETGALLETFKRALAFIMMLGLGFGLGLVQFIPLFEFVQSNWRADRSSLDTVLSYAHKPRDILQFIMPNFYGNPSHHIYFDVFQMATVSDLKNAAGDQIHFIDWGIKNYVEGALYLGVLPLFLALYAIFDAFVSRVRRQETLIFAALGIVSLTFMFGLPTYALIYALPGFNQLNSPFRWIYALTFVVAILAGFGLHALSQARSPRIPKIAGILVSVLGGVALLGLLASRAFYAQIESIVTSVLESMTRATEAFANAQAFYSYEFTNFLIFAIMLFASGIIFWLASRKFRGWQVFAVVLVIADLWIASWGFNPASDPALLEFTPPAIEYLLQQEDDFRYLSIDDPTQAHPRIMNANAGWRYGLDDVRGYDSIIPRQYVNFMRAFAPQTDLDYNRIAPLYTDQDFAPALDSPLLSLLNIRYVLTHPDIQLPDDLTDADGGNYSHWQLVFNDPSVQIWENTRALPRVYTVAESEFSGNWLDDENGNFSFDNLSIPDEITQVAITRDTGREKFMDVSLSESVWLIVSESYDPGWRAFMRPVGADEDEETELPVERVFGNFQAVQLPFSVDGPNELTIRMVYSPLSLQLGLFGSVISLLVILLLLGIWLWRSIIGLNTEDSSTGARVARNSVAPIILNLFNRGIDFVFAIIMLRILSVQEVGVYYYAVVIFVWFDIFTNFGLDVFLIREISRDKSKGGYYFFNTTILRLLLSFVGIPLLLGFLFVSQSNAQNPITTDGIVAILVLYIGLFPANLSKGMSSLFYAHEKAEYPAAIATITTINKVVMGVVVLVLGYGIIGLAGVSVVNNLITLAVLVYSGRFLIGKIASKMPDIALLRKMLVESFPLMLNHFLATIFFQVDIVLLQWLKGERVVGQYSLSYRWLLAINIIPAFFTQAMFPVLSRQAHEDMQAFQISYRFGIKLMFALSLPIAVGFTVLAEPLSLILGGPKYLPESAIALQIMIWSIPIGWMNSLTQYVLLALDMQRLLTWAFFAAVGFNIVTNLLLIPQYGFQAAAFTTIASEATLFVGFAILLRSRLQFSNWWALLWKPGVATVAMIGVTVLLMPIHAIVALIAGSIVYLVVLLFLRPLDAQERDLFDHMLPERLKTMWFFGPLLRPLR